jgi:hypothetical protein
LTASRTGRTSWAAHMARKSRSVSMQLVDAEHPPLRLFVGPYPYAVAEKLYRDRLATWDDWRRLAEQAA